jgi:hypothetical protein
VHPNEPVGAPSPIKPSKNRFEGTAVTVDASGQPLSYVYSDEWDFSQQKLSANGQKTKVKFSGLPEGRRQAIQETLSLFLDVDSTPSTGDLLNHRNSLVILADCLGSHEWALIDQEPAFREFKRALKKKKAASGTVKNYVTTLNKLHHLGIITRFIEEAGVFAAKYCCPHKKETKQAIAIPERMAQSLYKAALDMVERYHTYRHQISQGYARYFDAMQTFKHEKGYTYNYSKCIGPNIKHAVPHEEFSLDGLAQCGQEIQTACLLVVQGFSGVRKTESLSFNKDSYDDTRKYGDIVVPLLKGEITKNQPDGKPKQETWVTHPIAEKALELAYDMSQFAREHYQRKYAGQAEVLTHLDSAFLVLDITHQKKEVAAGNFGVKFPEFMKKHMVAANEGDVKEFDLLNPSRKGELKVGGYLPKFSPHDLRRTFAVFLVRNKLGNLMTLKHQYKHWNVLMTAWYKNHAEFARMLDMSFDIELLDMIDEANISVMTEALFDIANSETLSGGKGERIMAERNSDDYAGTMYQSREEIERRVRSGKVSVVDHPTGYCLKKDCIRICASDRSTQSCQHEVVTPEKARARIPYRERLIAKFNALNAGQHYYMANILTDMALKIESIERTLTAHNIPFTPFKADMIIYTTAFEVAQ